MTFHRGGNIVIVILWYWWHFCSINGSGVHRCR